MFHKNISTLNIESLTKGIYYLKIAGAEIATAKFVKK